MFNFFARIAFVYFVCFFCAPLPSLQAQTDAYRLGVLSQINISYTNRKAWTYSFRLESRDVFLRGNFGVPTAAALTHERLLFLPMVTTRIGTNGNIGLAYLLQYIEGNNSSISPWAHRYLLQYTYLQRYENFKAAHRFLFEQTFRRGVLTNYRFRYRYGVEIPLSGQTLNPKEFYLRDLAEVITTITSANIDLEVRAQSYLGYQVSPLHKVEIGMDYRLNQLLRPQKSHQFWIALAWFVSLSAPK
jgi:hypothetical protein